MPRRLSVAIVARAVLRVHASTIYRRWPSRIELIEKATFPGLSPLSVEPTGDLPRDLRRFIRTYVAAFGGPRGRGRPPRPPADVELARPPQAYLRVSARPQFQASSAPRRPAASIPTSTRTTSSTCSSVPC